MIIPQISFLISLLITQFILHFPFITSLPVSCSSGDDAKDVRMVPIGEILRLSLAFDHRRILTDYLTQYHAYALL